VEQAAVRENGPYIIMALPLRPSTLKILKKLNNVIGLSKIIILQSTE